MNTVKTLLLAVYNDQVDESMEEIGICYIASYLRQNGYSVKLIGHHETKINYDDIVAYNPRVIGMPIYDASKDSVYRVSRELRNLLPNTPIILGGITATFYGRELLEENQFIDATCQGEGEETWLEIVKALEQGKSLNGISGITFRYNGEIIQNKQRTLLELDDLPWAARDLLADNTLKIAQLSTSRGCTGNCSFCCSRRFWKTWRGKKIQNVVDEMEYIIKAYGVQRFNFIDCTFEDPGGNYDRIKALTDEISRRQLHVSYYADVCATIHKILDAPLMEALKTTGLCGVFCGLEAANNDDLTLYNKRARIEDNKRVLELFNSYHIHVDIGFILYNPYSTVERLRKNMLFLNEYGYASCFAYFKSKYRLYRGTMLYERVVKEGLKTESFFNDPFCYKFVHPEIELLTDYIIAQIETINQRTNIDNMSYYYHAYYIPMLIYLERQLQYHGERTLVDAVAINERTVKKELALLGNNNTKWFIKLLDLVEDGWDIEKADSITAAYLSDECMVNYIRNLERLRRDLYKTVLKAGYEQYLLF